MKEILFSGAFEISKFINNVILFFSIYDLKNYFIESLGDLEYNIHNQLFANLLY